ncbi:MAG: hypothetical protein LKG20_02775 [Tetrasphaera jenkinsii]|jgi:hypothetical protein|uniref:Uncharacterized protein n=1 Tax=Nostocoides jenkinsii Ben 74 TaxID=1193518 RepID=A0A077MFA2_9MICO|nr:hypothetical protein [Tetrasphaera jenkinsii]MCI1261200.1 hypothetical protein [Tetrasphaera jenkinsii]CCI53877.1 hypothetical protein BN13_500005 [Tetrasphaera jenkinsii Ben 74]
MSDFVLTPGGYRPAKNVHYIPPDHTIQGAADGIRILGPQGQLVLEISPDSRHDPSRPLLPTNLTRLSPNEILRSGDSILLPAHSVIDEPGGPPVPRRVGEGNGHLEGRMFRRIDDITRLVKEPRQQLLRKGIVPATPINGWVAFTGWTNGSGSPISSFSTTWTVPAEPTTDVGQTIFLFNGIQNSDRIYQPVLQWGPSAAGGGPRWAVASWYVDGIGGTHLHTDLVDVRPGDVLTGVMTLTGTANGLHSYDCAFAGIANTGLLVTDIQELTWANETLEAYGVFDHSHYPPVSRTTMGAIEIRTRDGAAPHFTWTPDSVTRLDTEHAVVEIDGATNGSVSLRYTSELGDGAWIARHGLDSQEFQALFDDLTGNQGMELVCVSGYDEGGARYAAIWRKQVVDHAWQARHGLDSAGHQDLFDTLPADGWYPVLVNGYNVGGTDLYASIWHRSAVPPLWSAQHGLTPQDYQCVFDEYSAAGWVPVWVSGFGDGDDVRFACIWHRRQGWSPRWAARHGLDHVQHQAAFDDFVSQGLHPSVVCGYNDHGTNRFVSVFTDAPSPSLWVRHGISEPDYQAEFDGRPGEGWSPSQTNSWRGSTGTTFNVTFAK